MDNILLSICISSYNRGTECFQLVKKIQSIEDTRCNIYICDDASDEATVIKLKSLISDQVVLILNDKNIGPCKNWFKTIDSGTGRYILHILDRDDINIKYLKVILDILEQNSVGAGYFGKSSARPVEGVRNQKYFTVCETGREAFLTLGGVPVHPTGFFVERNLWKKGDYKRFFFENNKFGIYPHSYVLGIIATRRDVLYSPIPFYSYVYRGENKKSNFYVKNKSKNYWWLPDNVIKTYNCLITYLIKFSDDSYRNEFICRRFCDGLNRATYMYRKIAEDSQEMDRYGEHIEYVSPWRMLLISWKYKMIFSLMLKKSGLNERNIQKELNKVWFAHIKKIMKEC